MIIKAKIAKERERERKFSMQKVFILNIKTKDSILNWRKNSKKKKKKWISGWFQVVKLKMQWKNYILQWNMDIFKSKYCPQLKLNKRFYLDNEPYSRRLSWTIHLLDFSLFFFFVIHVDCLVYWIRFFFFVIILYFHKNAIIFRIFLKIIVFQ